MTANKARPIVTLTTDFGTSSPYIAQMKGIILTRNPELQLVDITHDISPQDIHGGAIVLDDVSRRFPHGTIHVAVVDPGVGTERQIVFAQIGEQRFIAPDNGLLTFVVRRTKPQLIVAVTKETYFLPEVHPTFHGRDIMAPVAAHLSLGLRPQRLGDQLDSLVMLPIAEPVIEAQRITGVVLQIDRFGNLITNITTNDLMAAKLNPQIHVRCRDQEIEGLVNTYGDRVPGTLVALVGSNGRLEIALVHGSASDRLGARVGDEVVVMS